MSKKPHVIIAMKVSKEVENYIAEHCTYQKWTGEGGMPQAELLKLINEADGLLTSGARRIDKELLDQAPRLKVVSNIAVGYNNFNLEEMKAHHVLGTHTPYVLDDTVADLVFGLILASARRIPELDRFVKAGQWKKGMDEVLFGSDVHHKILGIIGMGRIGKAIGQRAVKGFDMKLLYHNRSRNEEVEENLGAKYCTLDSLLQESDFVVLMTPLTPETRDLMGSREFDLMKPTSFFINASRGETVDEQALIEGLKQGKIRGAGLDVFRKEPVDSQNPLLQFPNVITIPHIGSSTALVRDAMAMRATQNLVNALKGEGPIDLVPELR
ncbi:2-hydroxyacid dehydrogenase [Desulfitobacterium sp. AusDCA]|uniref:2-hydroxyacid dehydrogenase n=1 Tax=Desulfitobacterium sp. AusDCA TaxID=3240383 RepID=UPI003DA72CC3